jgi:hypothetical protein
MCTIAPAPQYHGERGTATGVRNVHGHWCCQRGPTSSPAVERLFRSWQSISIPSVSVAMKPWSLTHMEANCALQKYSCVLSSFLTRRLRKQLHGLTSLAAISWRSRAAYSPNSSAGRFFLCCFVPKLSRRLSGWVSDRISSRCLLARWASIQRLSSTSATAWSE